MPANSPRLAVSNQKGGVGKTAVAINIAGALATHHQNVLFVDADPQGNATEAWGAIDAYDAKPPTFADVLTDASKRDHVNDLITNVGEVDLLPSNIEMTLVERELTMDRRGSEQLDMALAAVASNYDIVIIDCPPNLGNLTDNALYAAENVLIPALAESTSKRAFELLADHIQMLEGDYSDEGLTITERGVVINRIDIRKNQANEMIDWIEAAYPDIPVWRVRERAAIQNAIEHNQSLQQYAPDTDMAHVFAEIAADLIRQYGLDDADTEVPA